MTTNAERKFVVEYENVWRRTEEEPLWLVEYFGYYTEHDRAERFCQEMKALGAAVNIRIVSN